MNTLKPRSKILDMLDKMKFSNLRDKLRNLLLLIKYFHIFYDEYDITIDIWECGNNEMMRLLENDLDTLTDSKGDAYQLTTLDGIEAGLFEKRVEEKADVLELFYKLKWEEAQIKGYFTEKKFIQNEVKYLENHFNSEKYLCPILANWIEYLIEKGLTQINSNVNDNRYFEDRKEVHNLSLIISYFSSLDIKNGIKVHLWERDNGLIKSAISNTFKEMEAAYKRGEVTYPDEFWLKLSLEETKKDEDELILNNFYLQKWQYAKKKYNHEKNFIQDEQKKIISYIETSNLTTNNIPIIRQWLSFLDNRLSFSFISEHFKTIYEDNPDNLKSAHYKFVNAMLINSDIDSWLYWFGGIPCNKHNKIEWIYKKDIKKNCLGDKRGLSYFVEKLSQSHEIDFPNTRKIFDLQITQHDKYKSTFSDIDKAFA